MPPPVGSGCRQISVATGARCSGTASSPTRFSPSAVRIVTGSLMAGRTVLARISVIDPSPPCPCAGARAAWPPLPARIVPVPPFVRARGLRGPHHHVRGAGPDFLTAAGAPVGLGGRGAGHLAHHPRPVRPLLRLRRAEPDHARLVVGADPAVRCPADRRIRPASAATRAAPDIGRETTCLTRAHGRQAMAPP